MESESYEWSPVQKNEDWEDLDWDKRLDEPQELGIYLDEPSRLYGSPQEQEARSRAIEVLGHLKAALNKRRAVGIGHNQPPEELEAEEIGKLRQATVELKVEFSRESPSIEAVKRETSLFRDALIAASKWAAKKADKAADAAAGVVGVGFGGWLLSKIPAIQTAFNAIIDWLEVAAKMVF